MESLISKLEIKKIVSIDDEWGKENSSLEISPIDYLNSRSEKVTSQETMKLMEYSSLGEYKKLDLEGFLQRFDEDLYPDLLK